MTKIERYIYVTILLIIITFGILMYSKYTKLERENIILKSEQFTISDSEKENEILKENILSLEEKLIYYQYQIDSLEDIKQKVIVKYEYIISDDITEGVKKLRENLKCEKY